MSYEKPEAGSIGWFDLTVPNAGELKDFYSKVTGWIPKALAMEGYDDFVMSLPGSGTPVAGLCHARGVNEKLPPQWLIYITVKNIDSSIAECKSLGGNILAEPKNMGGFGKYCVIQDPAGAVCALFEAK